MNKHVKEYFDNIPKEYTNLGKKIYMYYGKEYPIDIFNNVSSPFYKEIHDLFLLDTKAWRKYWWADGDYEKQPYSICKFRDENKQNTFKKEQNTKQFSKEFLEWMENHGE